MRSNHDVIIVGCGPSGATLAYELSRRGVDVLAVDKAVFPRDKCCGGGVTVKAGKLLGEMVSEVAEDSISSALFAISGSELFQGSDDHPLMYTVSRDRFDHRLLQRAEEAGAGVLQGVSVDGVTETETSVDVSTAKGDFRAKYVIGADGARSVVGKCLNFRSHGGFVGIESEVFVGDDDMDRWKSTILTDLGWTSKGYGWVFPKKDHLSIGIGAPIGKARDLRLAYRDFLNSLELGRHKIVEWSAGIIPMYSGRPRVVQGRVALIGDAAGLADPMTGEGIGNAVLSARLAAPAIEDALLHSRRSMRAYQDAVEDRLAPDIEAARFFSRIIFTMPKKLLNLAGRDGRLWNVACSLVRGEATYSMIKGRVEGVGGVYSILRGKAALAH